MPHRERYLFVCTNRRDEGNPKGSCAQSGSEPIVAALKAALVRRGAVKLVRACATGCLDLCEAGVAAVQEPSHVAYGGVTLADVEELADALVAGDVVARLVVHGPEGSRPATEETLGKIPETTPGPEGAR